MPPAVTGAVSRKAVRIPVLIAAGGVSGMTIASSPAFAERTQPLPKMSVTWPVHSPQQAPVAVLLAGAPVTPRYSLTSFSVAALIVAV
jgi:hypothetical protein